MLRDSAQNARPVFGPCRGWMRMAPRGRAVPPGTPIWADQSGDDGYGVLAPIREVLGCFAACG